MENTSGIEKVSFNIYASSRDSADRLEQAVKNVIGWFGERGMAIDADMLTDAIGKMCSNAFLWNIVFNHVKNNQKK